MDAYFTYLKLFDSIIMQFCLDYTCKEHSVLLLISILQKLSQGVSFIFHNVNLSAHHMVHLRFLANITLLYMCHAISFIDVPIL